MCEQEKLEKKKAKHAKKMKNKIAMIHKEAEETRALVEAKRGEYLLKAEETAAKYRSTGHIPKKGHWMLQLPSLPPERRAVLFSSSESIVL